MVRETAPQKYLVGSWMTLDPVTASPDEKLSSVQQKMFEGGFRCVPVVKEGKPIGIVTDRDIKAHTGFWDHTEAFKAMTETLITVSPSTTIREAARLLRERKIDALPVVEDNQLAGIITTSDVLNALTSED
jgi:acetoin utilization protein AcuB